MDGSDIAFSRATPGTLNTSGPHAPGLNGADLNAPGLAALPSGGLNPGGTGRSRSLITVWERRTATAGQFPLSEQTSAVALRSRSLMAEQTSAVALRSRSLMAEDRTRVLHITSALAGEGVSTVARELVHAVSRMPSCKTLLLDANANAGQSTALGGALPNIVSGYEARGGLEVIECGSPDGAFHAAAWPLAAASPAIPPLSNLLRAVYDLIVVDCPPILSHPHLPDISGGTQQVLLVIRSEVSPVRLVQRAKREIERLRGTVWGAVLAGQRQVLPRGLDRWF